MDIVQRADLALADLTANGGYLDAEHQDTFYRNILDEPTILRECRGVQMGAPEWRLPKIGLGSRILRPASQGTGAQDNGTNNRHLAAASRFKPDFGQVTMKSEEFIAEIHIHDEVLEDNLEKGNLTQTILQLMAERIALDLEELILLGDKASGDAYLAKIDGVLKLSSSHVVDAGGEGINVGIFNDMKKALPTKFRRNLSTMRYYSSMDVESDYRVRVAARQTNAGDAMLIGGAPVPVLGVPLKGIALMPQTNGLLLNPQNIIWGVQRNVRIERERDIRARSWIIVVTLRAALCIEEVDAVVKLTNLGGVNFAGADPVIV
ncbi:capsid protein [Rhizobium phage RHph_I4]|nr:capsid protein [Rhizobium phage RHph_I4]